MYLRYVLYVVLNSVRIHEKENRFLTDMLSGLRVVLHFDGVSAFEKDGTEDGLQSGETVQSRRHPSDVCAVEVP